MTTDEEAASALATTPAPPVATTNDDDDDDSNDDDPYDDDDDEDDDDDSEEDPFANLSRFQRDRRRKLQHTTTYSSEEDSDDDDDDDSDSGSKKPPATKSIAVVAEKQSPSSSGKKRKAASSTMTTAADDDFCEVISSSSSTFSDDENIDIEIENIAKSTKSSKTTTTSTSATTTAPKRTTRRSARMQPPEDARDPSVRAASNAALEEARRAREALKVAQSYKANEEEDEEDDDVVEVISLPPSPDPAAAPPPPPPPTTTTTTPAIHFSGATLRLTFRYRHPTTKKDCTTNVKLKSDQPFQYAVEEFEMTNNNRGQQVGLKIVGATFDGRKLDMTKPPTLYDMEDEDLVDVDVIIDENPPLSSLVRMPPPPQTAIVAAAPAFLGATLRLTFRYQHPTTKKDCTTNIKLKSDQPLQYAVIEFEMQHRGSDGLRMSSAVFDGRKLDMSKTPAFYDMDDEDLVDVDVKGVTASSSATALAGAAVNVAAPSAARLKPSSRSMPGNVHATSNAAAPMMPRAVCVRGAAQGAKITVNFRINGNSSDIASYTQDPKNMFALQMNLMCRTRGIVPEQCKWEYGSRALCPRTTPESLGITSGEMIVDVAVSSSKAATSRAAQRAAKAITAAGRCIGRRGRR